MTRRSGEAPQDDRVPVDLLLADASRAAVDAFRGGWTFMILSTIGAAGLLLAVGPIRIL